MRHYQIIITPEKREPMTMMDLSEATGVHPELLRAFIENGLLEPLAHSDGECFFGLEAVPRVRLIQRLRLEIGVNLAGVAVIIELLDKVEHLQYELEWLRKYVE